MLPSLAPTQVIIFALLLAWLGACVVYDLRSRQVPALLTILPLVLAALWQLFHGGWQMVLLVIALILVSDLPWAKWRIPLACLVSVLALSFAGSSESVYATLVIFAEWALWEIGATGGADANRQFVRRFGAREHGRHPVGAFHPRVGGGEDLGRGAQTMKDLAEEPLARISAAALGQILRTHLARQFGNLGGFGYAGMVLP